MQTNNEVKQHDFELTHVTKEKRRKWRSNDRKWGLIMVSPYLFHLVFIAITFFTSFYFSFTEYDLLTTPEFTGLRNYEKLIYEPLFWKSFWNTVYFTVLFVPLQAIIALVLAAALNQKLKGLKLFRMSHFIPVISSWAVINFVADAIFNPRFGLANEILKNFGFPAQQWLNDETIVIPLLVFIAVWKGVGYMMIIFLAGLQNIPGELYEAADIDGAGVIKKFFKITMPLISGTTFLVLILSTISTFQSFEQIYVMTGGVHDVGQMGGPNNASLVLMLYLYREGFSFLNMGYASAIAWVLFIVLLMFTMIQVAMQKKWVYYDK